MLLPSTTTRRVYERTHAGGSDGIAGVFGRTKLSRRPPRTQLRSVAFSTMTTGDELRGLMRLWPHGVSILSVDVEGDRMGVTVSSLVSLSLEPPLIGVSIGKDASCYELLRSAGRFAVSLLGSEQEELARRFAAGYPPIVHWQGVPTREGQVAPLIEGALGWIEAKTQTEADAGDHTFFIADVLSIDHGPSHHALVYRESTYHSV